MDYKKIRKSAEALQKSAERLDQFHTKAKPTRTGKLSKRDSQRLERLEKQFSAAHNTVKSALPARAEKQMADKKKDVADEPAARFEFDTFFTKVAQGFIDAQSKLDAASAEYLSQVSAQQHVLPSVFRMPKLDASMKFALEEGKNKGLQLLFFKNESTTTNLNEQSVHFEIVAAPPPVGVPISPVIFSPLLSKTRRAELFQSIQDFLLPPPNSTPAKTDAALDRKNLVANPDNVIIISVSGDRSFLLTVADGKGPGNIGVWYWETGEKAEESFLSVLRKFGSAMDPNIGKVMDVITKLGTVQKEFLSPPKESHGDV